MDWFIQHNYQTLINLLEIVALYILVFGLTEILYKKGLQAETTRKIVHIAGGVVSALLPFFVKFEVAIALGVAFSLLLIISKHRKLLNSVHKIKDYSVGALLLAPSLTFAAAIFWPINPLIFQGSALVLGLSDGIAGIIGKRYGKRFYNVTGVKTIEGSFVFFLITLCLLFWFLIIGGAYTPSKISIVFGGALSITMVEAILGKGWDNL